MSIFYVICTFYTSEVFNYQMEEIADRLVPVLESHFTDPDHFEVFTTLRYHPGLFPIESPTPLLDAIDETPIPESMFFLLAYHVAKLQRSGEYFNFNLDNVTKEYILLGLANCLNDKDRLISYRIRIVLNSHGDITFTPVALPPDNLLVTNVTNTNFDIQNIGLIDAIKFKGNSKLTLPANMLPISTDPVTEPWIIHVAPTSIIPNQFTSFKTTHRDMHNHFRALYNLPIPGKTNTTNTEGGFTNMQDVLLYTSSNHVLETTIASIAVHRLIIHPTNGKREWGWLTPPLSTGCQDAAVRRWLIDNSKVQEQIIDLKSIKNGEIIMVFNAVSGIRFGQIRF